MSKRTAAWRPKSEPTPSLARLAAPKIRGITTHPTEPHPLAESVCASCGVTGFVQRTGDRLVARLSRRPVDGVELLSHARGMNSVPEAYLTWIMSAALYAALEHNGLTTGLSKLPLVRVRGACDPYFVFFARHRLGPMAAPYGLAPEQRNCDECGFVNAARRRYPLYPRPDDEAHWYSAAPHSATSLLASGDVWSFLMGPGRELYGPLGAKVSPLRAGWWPDERDEAFLAEDE